MVRSRSAVQVRSWAPVKIGCSDNLTKKIGLMLKNIEKGSVLWPKREIDKNLDLSAQIATILIMFQEKT